MALSIPKRSLILITLAVCALAATVYWTRSEALLWHFWHQLNLSKDAHEFQLNDYEVVIDRKPLHGYQNASGLAYNRQTHTLFTVLNDVNKIVELSMQGEPLREIQVHGAIDLEGITHIEGDYFVVADERDSRLSLLQITAEATEVDMQQSQVLRLGLNARGNKNFEGVDWDSIHQRLIVVKERDPKYVIAVKGFYQSAATGGKSLEIEHLKQFDHALKWVLRDLSSVTYYEKTGHMFLLSHESRLLKEFDEEGNAMGTLALWRGFHGLKRSIPQAEGVAIDDEENIYIISEPNLFYAFRPKQPHL